MARKNSGSSEGQGPSSEANEEQKEIVVPKDAIVDAPVTVVSLSGDPYHKDGEEFEVGKKTADELVKRGWVKLKEKE